MPIHSILRVHVQSQSHRFRAPASASNLSNSWGSAWACDALQLAKCDIPFLSKAAGLPPLSEDDLRSRLSEMGIKPSSNNQFPIVVTNAHVVHGMKECSLQEEGDSALTGCQLLCVFPSRDLAILLPPDSLRDRLVCSEISLALLDQGTPIKVYGYPRNGQGERSLTEGTISRIINGTYAHANLSTLEYEMSATINGGNSGGPVVIREGDKERVVAIVHQHQTNATNQFNSIPVFHLVAGFRDYLQHKKDFGLQTIPFVYGFLKNPSHREFHKLDPKGSSGVIIQSMSKMYETPLNVGDILLQVGEFPINSDGKIALFKEGRVPFENYLHFLPPFSKVDFQISRAGQIQRVSCTLEASLHSMLREYRLPTVNPPRFCQHGLFFSGEMGYTDVSKEYKTSNGGFNMGQKLYSRMSDVCFKSPSSQGTVVFFPFTNTQGYQLDEANVVSKVEIDGKVHRIRDIFHLYTLLNHSKASPDEKSEGKRFIAFYERDEDLIPYFVVPALSAAEELENRKRFNIDERFSPLNFAEKYMPKTRGWAVLREKFSQGLFKAPKPVKEAQPTSVYKERVALV